MAELTEGARKYLEALDKKRKSARERGGFEAEAAIVQSQKQKANYLAGDDDKKRSLANAKSKKQAARDAYTRQTRLRDEYKDSMKEKPPKREGLFNPGWMNQK